MTDAYVKTAGDSLSRLFAPFVLAALELVVLWTGWYQYDPKSAGQVLGMAEGVSAAYHFKNGRRILGGITAAGAVSQWQQSTSLPPRHPTSASPQTTHVLTHPKPEKARPAVKPALPANVRASDSLPQELLQLADLHSKQALTDQEFALAKARLLGAQER